MYQPARDDVSIETLASRQKSFQPMEASPWNWRSAFEDQEHRDRH
jgi:hypothetical protein